MIAECAEDLYCNNYECSRDDPCISEGYNNRIQALQDQEQAKEDEITTTRTALEDALAHQVAVMSGTTPIGISVEMQAYYSQSVTYCVQDVNIDMVSNGLRLAVPPKSKKAKFNPLYLYIAPRQGCCK